MKPGAVRIGSPAKVEGLRTVAFQNPDGQRVLIVLNVSTVAADFAIASAGARFKVALPARSAGTFVW